MRRYMKLVAAAVLAVSVLAGCQQSAGESSTQAATETVRETESSAEAPEGSQAKGSAETSGWSPPQSLIWRLPRESIMW